MMWSKYNHQSPHCCLCTIISNNRNKVLLLEMFNSDHIPLLAIYLIDAEHKVTNIHRSIIFMVILNNPPIAWTYYYSMQYIPPFSTYCKVAFAILVPKKHIICSAIKLILIHFSMLSIYESFQIRNESFHPLWPIYSFHSLHLLFSISSSMILFRFFPSL